MKSRPQSGQLTLSCRSGFEEISSGGGIFEDLQNHGHLRRQGNQGLEQVPCGVQNLGPGHRACLDRRPTQEPSEGQLPTGQEQVDAQS